MDKHVLKKYIDANPDAKLRDLVSTLLYDEIVALRLAPGTKLNINQISASLGVSRTPVAEAIVSLSEKGFVVSHPGQVGSYVLDLSLIDMINLYQVRDAIEGEAASLCAHNASEGLIRELSNLAEAFRDCVERKDIRGMKDTDMPFHRLIIDSCGNPYIAQTYNLILPKLIMYQSSMMEFIGSMNNDTNPWMPSVKYNHTAVVSAIRMRLPELARQSMLDHIATSLNFTSLSGNAGDPFHALQNK